MNEKITAVFGDPIDENALDQLEVVMEDDRAVKGALMADHHLGYSMPIGGVVVYENAISPSGVGFDIACGNKAVRTDILADELGDLKPWMRQIQKRISFGLKRSASSTTVVAQDHELFDEDIWSEIDTKPGQPLKQKAREQLGTVGSGNHYVDLLKDEEGYLWIANHFGSRGLGHTIATMGLRWAYGLGEEDKGVEREEPAVLDLDTELGKRYLGGMTLAGEYAYAGRTFVIDEVIKLLGRPAVTETVHNHHNYAWLEDGYWVVRKGATPLTPSPSFIGGSMGDISVIVRGALDITNANEPTGWVEDIGALGSAPHGAGRVMSRTKAAGKIRKFWMCTNRNCNKFEPIRAIGNASPIDGSKCPHCNSVLRKLRMRDDSGVVDWAAVRTDLTERGIVVLGSGADEAPEVYKDLGTVLGLHSNIVVLHTLQPLGVVMAGDDVTDPYRD